MYVYLRYHSALGEFSHPFIPELKPSLQVFVVTNVCNLSHPAGRGRAASPAKAQSEFKTNLGY